MQDEEGTADLLAQANRDYAAGEIDAADRLCRQMIASDPDHLGALHLLGLIAYRRGVPDEALDLLRRAAEPSDAPFLHLANYAEFSRRSGRLAEAVAAARRAAALDSGRPFGWQLLGTMLLEGGQAAESRDCFETALRLDPGQVQARNNLAVALARLGQLPAAIDTFRELVRQTPENAQIHGNFAALLQEFGRYEDALAEADEAARLKPDRMAFHLQAATIEMHLGRHWDALARLALAERHLPPHPDLLVLKVHLLRYVDHHDEGVELCRAAVAEGVNTPELQHAFALVLQMAGHDAEALDAFDRTVAAAANPAAALCDKAVMLTQLGRLDSANATFERALAHDPNLIAAWYNKAAAKTYRPADPDIAAMERLLDGHADFLGRLWLHFALGKAHMDAGDADEAFRHWHEANRMKRSLISYDGDAVAALLADIAARPLAPSSGAPGAARLSDAPVFVVGMPRSGSSLIEQILASHPEVYGAGELVQLRSLFEREPDDEAGFEDIAGEALGKLRRLAGAAPRIIDKDLANFLHLGTIHRVFPRARIIHCRRDPLDTCYSAYTKLFQGSFDYTYDLAELGNYYRAYDGLMAHWRAVLPEAVFLEVDYEAVIADPEGETRRMLSFLDLSWSDSCLRFFETARAVRTASVAQVRQPLYRSSIGRTRAFKCHLMPLIEALGPLYRDDI